MKFSAIFMLIQGALSLKIRDDCDCIGDFRASDDCDCMGDFRKAGKSKSVQFVIQFSFFYQIVPNINHYDWILCRKKALVQKVSDDCDCMGDFRKSKDDCDCMGDFRKAVLSISILNFQIVFNKIFNQISEIIF